MFVGDSRTTQEAKYGLKLRNQLRVHSLAVWDDLRSLIALDIGGFYFHPDFVFGRQVEKHVC